MGMLVAPACGLLLLLLLGSGYWLGVDMMWCHPFLLKFNAGASQQAC
jgi:hypothetical protein